MLHSLFSWYFHGARNLPFTETLPPPQKTIKYLKTRVNAFIVAVISICYNFDITHCLQRNIVFSGGEDRIPQLLEFEHHEEVYKKTQNVSEEFHHLDATLSYKMP